MTPQKNPRSSKDKGKSIQRISLTDKLAFLGLIVASVGVVVAAYFGYLAIRQQPQTIPPDIISTVTEISSQNSQTQQAYFNNLKLTEQALLATATAIYAQQTLGTAVSEVTRSSSPEPELAYANAEIVIRENPSDNAQAIGMVHASTQVYIASTALDSLNQEWFFIRVYLTNGASFLT